MSAFDRLQNYNSRIGVHNEESVSNNDIPLDLTTTEGAFLNQVHNNGYKIYEEKGLDENGKPKYEFTELHDVITTSGNQVINAIAGAGKALKNGTKVLAENGFIAIEHLQVGERVYGEDGLLYNVLGVFPQGSCRVYEVTFNCGEKIYCNEEHLWTDIKGRTITTWRISQELEKSSKNKFILPSVNLDIDKEEVEKEVKALQKSKDIDDKEYNLLREKVNKCGWGISKKRGKIKFSKERYIVSVKETEEIFDMTCICVDNPKHLYLTEYYLPTHNTTASVFKIIHDIVTGEVMTLKSIPNGMQVPCVDKVWVCTFLRSGADELEKVLTNWQKKLGYSITSNQIVFSTLDAEFKRCLNTMGVELNIGEQSFLDKLFIKAVTSCNITRNGEYLKSEDYQILKSIVSYYRGRLDDRKYLHSSCKDYSLTPSVLDMLVNQYASLRNANNIVDFDEIQELLYKYLYVTPNKNVQEFVANRYKYIYIDEFQDTSQLQYAILKAYARGKLWINRDGQIHEDDKLYTGEEDIGKIVVIGDPSQCIYSFKGSDSKILVKNFDEDFKPCHSTLSVNWRCPSNILNPIVSSIHKNIDSKSQNIIPAKQGGEFYAYEFGSYKAMIEQLQEDIQVDMEQGNEVAILCRTNFDGMIPAFVLEATGRFNFSVSGKNMTLTGPLIKQLLNLSCLFTERSSNTVKSVLGLFNGRDKWALNSLIDTLKMNSLSIWTIDSNDLRAECYNIYEFVEEVKPYFYDNGVRHKEFEINALIGAYYYLYSNVFNSGSLYSENARAYINVILYILEENKFKDIYDFIDYIDLMVDRLNGRVKKNNAKIQIATVHEYKGKECDSVYVWNDSERVFPSNKCDEKDLEQLEEERRVHYIACTRAKKREHIYCLSKNVGLFVKEMDLKLENPRKPKVTLDSSNKS